MRWHGYHSWNHAGIEVAMIQAVVLDAIGHLISCSLITLPAVVYISHLLVPDRSRDNRIKRSIEALTA